MPKKNDLSADAMSSTLKGMHRVLRNRGIDQPVKVTFGTEAAPQVCWKWECRDQDGKVVCQWVQVPC